ncbi:MAG: DNA repair protein RecN [Firmicutes bacterium]|nr:DNA repair protein RecN [Bacillota bacterium]
MLAELYVENFALIERLQIEFSSGLNIITGETGAGKSLLTDAVGMLLGGKGDKDLIRQGTGTALIEGTFSGPFSHAVNVFCEENGIDNETIVVSREMNADGKNTVRLNGRRITLSFLEQLAPLLMNIHSQTEHFSLFKEEEQLLLLDRFGGAPILNQKEKVKDTFLFWQEKKKEFNELQRKVADKEKRLDYLRYQFKELEGFHLTSGEDEALREEIKLLSSGASRYDDAHNVYQALNGSDGEGAVDLLYQAVNSLGRIADKDSSVEKLVSTLNDVYYSLEDIREEILAYRDNIDVDPYRLEELETRLSEIKKAEKKYHADVDGIIAYQKEVEEEIAAFEDSDYFLGQAESKEREAYASFFAEAEILTDLRMEIGKELSFAIEEQLHDMKLPNARFAVHLYDAPLSPEGKDGVTFMATMNKGEDLRPLAKVASGGEISRVLLGTKIILGKIDEVQTMIFDEIDSGLGGETAARVGEKLRLLGKGMQVFAVTHSPLVAVFADHHYYIEKREENERVVVTLTTLEKSEIRREIARMLSGDRDSEISLHQADELLNVAK